MKTSLRILATTAILLLSACMCAPAAEFDIDAGRAVLRRLQYCVDCGSALLVTDVRTGERIRCPDCGKEQNRLENEFLLTQLYQICKLCSSPLNPEGHAPGDIVQCPTCLTPQSLIADAFLRPDQGGGLGYKPGFPPGTGRKTLLLSPNRPDAAITAVPTDSLRDLEEVAAAAGTWENPAKDFFESLPQPTDPALTKIPGPPPGFRRERPAAPADTLSASAAPADALSASGMPAPSTVAAQPTQAARADDLFASGAPSPSAPAAAPSLPERAAGASAFRSAATPWETPGLFPAAPSAAPALSGAVEVPAVTAELFGGVPAARSPSAAGSYIATGDVVARVDGQPVYARDVDLVVLPVLERLRRQTTDEAALAAREAELRREVLSRLIDRELAAREAAAIGHAPNPAAVREREAELAQILAGSGIDLRREAERDVIMADMRRRFGTRLSPVTPGEVRAFYQAHKDEMRQPRRLALDQLVVYEERAERPDRRPARDIAFGISNLLEQGTPFDELRQRYDEFLPAAALPHAPPPLLPEEAYSRQILAAGGDLRAGAVFGPVVTGGAYIFGKVTDVRPAGPVPFTEAENAIRTRLETAATEKSFADWLAGLRARAKVEVLK